MRAAVVDREGRLLAREEIDTTPQRGIEDAGERLAHLLANVANAAGAKSVVGVGVSTAGPLNPQSGTYLYPPNLPGWHNKSMKPVLEAELELPVKVGHDATLAALAETRFGPHRGTRNLIYVTISTGVGGGIIANGQMVTGANGGAGEVGHITVRPGGRGCNLGCDGCFEGNASGPAIAAIARERLRTIQTSSLRDRVDGDLDKLDAPMVFEEAAAGDVIANLVVREVIDTVGIGLGSLLNILEPEAMLIGGGVSEGLRRHWLEVDAAVRRHSLPRYRDGAPIAITTLGDDASLLGAAALVFADQPMQDPA
jgi:glucokinase